MKTAIRPTEQTYNELQRAYDWFNVRLFDNKLPPCLITLQRNKRTMGYFSKDRFVAAGGEKTDEIAMNPEYFAVQPVAEVLSTLAHEMAHLWQEHFGKPGRGKYHNQEWADKMVAIGLMPSHSGRPGGRTTGDQMDHYIEGQGEFMKACRQLLTNDFQISWYDRFPAAMPAQNQNLQVPAPALALNDQFIDGSDDEQSIRAVPALVNPKLSLVNRADDNSNRVKYRCSGCAIQVWGKPELNILCGECDLAMAGA